MIYLAYVEQRKTTRGIARWLSQLGIDKAVTRFQHDDRPTMWSHSSVRNILINEVYKGNWYYGKAIGDSRCGGLRDKCDQIKVDVPAIIDPDVWDAAQRIMKQHAEIASRNRRRDYLLSGMVKCGCGRSMGAGTHRGVPFYKCNERTARHQSLEGRQCYEPQFDAKNLEGIVWKYIKNLMLGDFEKELAEAQSAQASRNEPLLSEIEVINGLLVEVENEAENLAHNLGKVSGVMHTKIMNEIEQVNQRHAQLTGRKAEIERLLNAQPLSLQQVESLREFRNRVVAGIEHATRADIRRYYEILNVKVLIVNHQVKVSCLIETITC